MLHGTARSLPYSVLHVAIYGFLAWNGARIASKTDAILCRFSRERQENGLFFQPLHSEVVLKRDGGSR